MSVEAIEGITPENLISQVEALDNKLITARMAGGFSAISPIHNAEYPFEKSGHVTQTLTTQMSSLYPDVAAPAQAIDSSPTLKNAASPMPPILNA